MEGLLLQAIFYLAGGLTAFRVDLEAGHVVLTTKSWEKKASLEDLERALEAEEVK